MKLNLNKWYKILSPRPVILISTLSDKGVSNTAPFSFVMPVSIEPALISFASQPSHDTAKNILRTKEFVVNIPGYKLINKLWICAEDFPYGVSEFEKAGLIEEKSSKVKPPRIKECFAHFECKLFKEYTLGDHKVFFGRVVYADISEEYFSKNKYLITKANPLIHIGGNEFASIDKITLAK